MPREQIAASPGFRKISESEYRRGRNNLVASASGYGFPLTASQIEQIEGRGDGRMNSKKDSDETKKSKNRKASQ